MKKAIVVILIVLLGFLGVYSYFEASRKGSTEEVGNENSLIDSEESQENIPVENGEEEEEKENPAQTVIGHSVEDNEILAYSYGEGDENLLLLAGIHGGYEWNTVLLAYEMMDYLSENPEIIPENLRVTVIPVLNPDGLKETVGTTSRFEASDVSSSKEVSGRFNANGVDLNRNFDCLWQPESTWKNQKVSAGDKVFSEPEALALQSLVETLDPIGVVVWYSAAGGVYASSCENGVSTETRSLTKVFAEASGYSGHEEYDFYEITGDAVNWLAKKNIPAISVLLTNHEDLEWNKNLAGVKAVLDYYAK